MTVASYDIPQADTSRVVYSWNPSDPAGPETPSYHGANRRGSVSLNLRGGLVDPPELPDDVATFTIAVNDVSKINDIHSIPYNRFLLRAKKFAFSRFQGNCEFKHCTCLAHELLFE